MKEVEDFSHEEVLDIINLYTTKTLSKKKIAEKYSCSNGLKIGRASCRERV